MDVGGRRVDAGRGPAPLQPGTQDHPELCSAPAADPVRGPGSRLFSLPTGYSALFTAVIYRRVAMSTELVRGCQVRGV